MIDVSKIDTDVIKALYNRGKSDYDIIHMTWDEVFDEYCEWHGIINWAPTLRRVMANAKNAQT